MVKRIFLAVIAVFAFVPYGWGGLGKESPIKLTVDVEGKRVVLRWNKPSDLSMKEFYLLYAPFPQGNPVQVAPLGNLTEVSADVPLNSDFYVVVVAPDEEGSIYFSNVEYFRIRNIWKPAPGTTWQWQLTGDIDTSVDAEMFDVDLFDTPVEVIEELHKKGSKVICYFSAGTYESWRPDAYKFPKEIIGKPLEDWPGERWLDIRQIDKLSPIMEARLDLAVEKGCDGVEPDNVDGYKNDTGFPITYEDQLRYNIWLARRAHQRGLSVGLKNDLEQVRELEPYFDWALNEECFSYDECEYLLPFIEHGKAVFGVEYELEPEKFCPKANEMGFSFMLKRKELDAWRIPCWELK